jgi:hypothetical protein
MGTVWRGATGPRLAWAAAAAIAAGLLVGSCSPAAVSTAPGASAPAGQPGAVSHRVISLNAISTLRSLFNRADGHTRLVLLLSPT